MLYFKNRILYLSLVLISSPEWPHQYCLYLKLTVLTRSSKLDLRFFETFKKVSLLTHHTTLRSVAWWDKTQRILKMRMNQVSKHENRVSSFQKPPFFLYSPLERISRNDFPLKKHNNSHLHVQRRHWPTALACTI